MRDVTIITEEPTIEIIAEMKLRGTGVMAMAKWVQKYRPECLPEGRFFSVIDLMPHNGTECIHGEDGEGIDRIVTDNALLAELAGRKCYDSFAEKGAKRTNAEYLASMWTGRDVVHLSTGYHPKLSFFFADISRRVSHELIRNYVGADRSEEGSPSQESTRFTEHYGAYIAHPWMLNEPTDLEQFATVAQINYDTYLNFMEAAFERYRRDHDGQPPKGMDRKRIYEAGSSLLMHSCATSFIWTTNPIALMKLWRERCDEAADLEMQRFAKKLRRICVAHEPNLFPGVKVS